MYGQLNSVLALTYQRVWRFSSCRSSRCISLRISGDSSELLTRNQ